MSNHIPGLCECGCGEVTPLATKTIAARSIIKGQPLRFVHGHNRRKSGVEYLIDPRSGCWVWQRARAYARKGYGVSYDGKKPRDAHLVVWERLNGPVPAGMELHHKCENPPCVNPDHLQLLSISEHRSLTRRSKATLSPEAVREIRAAPMYYGSGKKLAEKYGISEVYVCQIRKGRVRRDIE